MVSGNLQEKLPSRTRKNAHPPATIEQIKEQGAFLIEVLKTVEIELQKRGLLKIPENGSFHPVWFLAETERNIFLWRSGCSIIEQDDFEFWIDVRGLIQKRLEALRTFDSENPFMNSMWGSPASSEEQVSGEKLYLSSFIKIIESIEDHANALCLVAQSALKELCKEATLREMVLLPASKKAPKATLPPAL